MIQEYTSTFYKRLLVAKYNLLDKIDSPEDLKKIKKEDLKLLSEEVSQYIHDTITKIGGHYSSPLGVVDLTIALHYAYNTPDDKLCLRSITGLEKIEDRKNYKLLDILRYDFNYSNNIHCIMCEF